MNDVIEWLRSPEGEDWSRVTFSRPCRRGGRSGMFGSVEPAEHPETSCNSLCAASRSAYRPMTEQEIRMYFPCYRLDSEQTEGLSSPG